ncbi:MAG: UDP-N-acetylmuramoyl-L-alanine--D-glutamate ligase [candidate division WOR-3 bacterium]|nr:MAG: UDP-N-acetylmuramoyl-L-alanine--D-glutamate ligase [candidate division WOR-3 bacterium]
MKVLLLGLGRANLAVAHYLVGKREQVHVYDEKMSGLSAEAQQLISSGQVGLYDDEQRYDLAISSPGFPPGRSIYTVLKRQGTKVIDEIEYVYQQLNHPTVIAVTGTNGKSTTAALISSILVAAQKDHFLGGNMAPGKPFSHVMVGRKSDYYVLEVSSFQLMRIETFRPHVAVLTNIGIDHLNWHSDMEEYRTAKERIFSNQESNDYAVLNYDDEWIRNLAGRIKARAVYFGQHATSGVSLDGKFHYEGVELFAHNGLPLRGTHNFMNMAAAIAVAKVLKIPTTQIEQGVMNFTGLPHRLEDVGVIHDIRYINNSMCTNAGAAVASFHAVEGPKIVILGGRHKGDEGTQYFDVLIKHAKACVLLGENSGFIAEYLEAHQYDRYAIARDMNDAVVKARRFAEPGDVIFLNPGFASFDRFRDFEERGEVFKNAARQD